VLRLFNFVRPFCRPHFADLSTDFSSVVMQLLSESLARLLLVLRHISHYNMEKTMKHGCRYTAVAAVAALVYGIANAQSPVRSDDAARDGAATTSPSASDRSPPSRSSGIAAANENERTPAEKTLASSDHRASTIIGATVLDSAGEKIGEVDDLVVSAENEEVQAVISVGGVAGIGDTLIAVPLDELQISPRVEQPRSGDQPRIHVDTTAEQLLESKPEFQYEQEEQDERTAGPV